jgi:hypothetical protein
VTDALRRARVGPALAWCSGRAIGNVGDHVGDDPAAVVRNRRALARAAGLLPAPEAWVWVRQVHGAAVHVATEPTPPDDPPEADAAATVVRGLPIAIVTADCAPLVLASNGAVAVVHAGHRGLAAGVIDNAVARVRELGTGAVSAFLAPCIRAPRYEFGAADLDAFVARFGPTAASTTRTGRTALDIPAIIRVVLARLDVRAFEDSGVCTADDAAYFSYRRDGQTGRQATVAVLP